MSIPYNKPWCNLQGQIELLRSRGLKINDEDSAKNALLHEGYYHLSAYFKAFQSEKDIFNSGTELQNVLDLYAFDRRLTLLFFDAIERIEVSLRSMMIHKCGEQDIYWYNNKEVYSHTKYFSQNQERWTEELERLKQKDGLMKEYYTKYSTKMPPCWIFFEVLAFGSLVRIYQNLKRTYRTNIASMYSIPDKDLLSGLRGLVDIRNICAHHERLWNRRCKNRSECTPTGVEDHSVFSYILFVKDILKVVSPTSTWTIRVQELLQKNMLYIPAMGVPEHWKTLLNA
jgi:abortive infection bacteriophage resistance protein